MSSWPLLLIAIVASVPILRAEAQEAGEEARIREVIGNLEAANNRGDVSAWVSLFDAEPVYMPAGVPAVTDRRGLRQTAEAGFSRYAAEIAIEPIEITVLDGWAIARARVTGHVRPVDGGEPIPIDNKELLVLRKSDSGEWKIARLMINSNG